MKFQIGSNKQGYIYSPTDMEVNNAPVYKCRRGQDGGSEHVLWLSRAKDGRWIAREAHTDSPEPVAHGKKIFMTQNVITDITNPGDIDWMWYNEKKEPWINFQYTFRTKHIEDWAALFSQCNVNSNAIDIVCNISRHRDLS